MSQLCNFGQSNVTGCSNKEITQEGSQEDICYLKF